MPTPQAALRVGLIGAGTTSEILEAALGRLAAMLPPGALLRLICRTGAASVPAGWIICRIAPTPPNAADATLVLDGDPANCLEAEEAADAAITRNCDVLLAVGDPRALAGPIRLATRLGLPVLSMAPDCADRLLTAGWEVQRAAPPEAEAAWEAVRARVAELLEPPALPPSSDVKLRSRLIWRAHRAAMYLLWHGDRAHDSRAALPEAWTSLYDSADALADGYADRYRSAYTLVLGFAALALVAAVLGLWLARFESISPFWTAIPEAGCLLAIVVLVRAARRSGWQDRLILWRLLAELCRKQAALSFVARSLPVASIARRTHGNGLGWVGWRFAAAVRAAPFPSGTIAGPALAQARDAAGAVLLRGQRLYHEDRAEAGRRREERLVWLGGLAFAATVVLVAVKLVLLRFDREWAEIPGLLASLLPAGAAALFGLRAYAELELMVRHSERVIALLDGAQASLDAMDTDRPGASQHIGDVLEDLAAGMLADVEGWVEVSRVKAVEAG